MNGIYLHPLLERPYTWLICRFQDNPKMQTMGRVHSELDSRDTKLDWTTFGAANGLFTFTDLDSDSDPIPAVGIRIWIWICTVWKFLHSTTLPFGLQSELKLESVSESANVNKSSWNQNTVKQHGTNNVALTTVNTVMYFVLYFSHILCWNLTIHHVHVC